MANYLFFQQMLEGLGEVQRLGRYFGNSGVTWATVCKLSRKAMHVFPGSRTL